LSRQRGWLDGSRYCGELIWRVHVRQFVAGGSRVYVDCLGHWLVREAEGWQHDLLRLIVGLSQDRRAKRRDESTQYCDLRPDVHY
jgi:hypothetical protein